MINAEFNDLINNLTIENLYQWDTYQSLKITGIDFGSITPKIHFANKKSTEALVVKGVLKDDGSCEVSIPNTLLAEKYDIVAYIYTTTGLTGKTIKSITIPIIPRLKPTNYFQPSQEDIIEIEKLELYAKLIIDGLTASDYSPTETYKRPNIVYYNYCTYMCISNESVTGINPTDDTTRWQKIAHSEHINDVSVDEEGKLTFKTSSGTSYNIDFQVKDVTLVDETDVPCLKLNNEEVNKVKYHLSHSLFTDITDQIIEKTEFKSQEIELDDGLYMIVVNAKFNGKTTFKKVIKIISIDLNVEDPTYFLFETIDSVSVMRKLLPSGKYIGLLDNINTDNARITKVIKIGVI